MKSITVASVLFTAASVSGAAITIPRQANSFSVTNFTASCIPHSLLCVYEFAVITNPTTASPSGNPSPAQCSLMLQGPDYLPPVQLTGCAETGAYSWAVDLVKEGGIRLNVTTPQDSHGNFTGSYEVPADQLVVEQHGAAISQRYNGPNAFAVPIGGASA
ncbi:hypothetical protein F5B19DRAFT_493606 [Rostrohypoxylon terebratum]|nr:hypothetical protein F5B19DRAFT_493606 [Rostrohypoxylon terebratum]